MATETSNITFTEATPSNIESLTTILARSFHPLYEYMRKALPDTPGMREWWRQVFTEEVSNPSCHPLIALDTSTNEVAGVLCLRLIVQDDDTGGFWLKHPWTDHNEEMWRHVVECQAHHERELMQGKPYFLLELMAVDHAYHSRGIGGKLVRKACEIADAAGYPILLQAGKARHFYTKLGLGFEVAAEPDWEGIYQTTLQIRRPVSQQ